MTIFEERANEERKNLNRLFPGNENLTKRDKIALIRKYQQIHLREKFPFGIPRNYITPIMLTHILKGR